MNKLLPTLILHKTKDIYLLDVQIPVTKFSPHSAHYELKRLNDNYSKVVLERLSEATIADSLPYAIIANYDLLASQNFKWAKALRQNELTKDIPVIAIQSDDKVVSPVNALKNGIDDCYKTPIDIKEVSERIDFLKKYKKKIQEKILESNYPLEVSITPIKRVLDVLIAAFAIVLFSPVFLLTGLLIALESRGPVIYRSKRSGAGYQEFDFLKFRSMYTDADARLRDLQHLNQYAEENPAFVKIKDDPRITKVGRIIRKFSIDELPQLFNVLKGDMSIVGNRPLPLYEAEQLTKEDAAYRFLAPAGITGLWQVTKRGKNDMSANERINLDVKYAKLYSFWLDLKIMFKTPFAIVQKENV
jgi:lipopolysaccharide/colanic/teichoic acid biosynthesis glycosyltransferase